MLHNLRFTKLTLRKYKDWWGSLGSSGRSGSFRGAKSFNNATISLCNHVATCSLCLVPRSQQHEIHAAAQVTNAAARGEPCYSCSRSKRWRLQLGVNYATLVGHRQHLACGRHASIFLVCTSMWPLKRPWKVPKIGSAMAWATRPAPLALWWAAHCIGDGGFPKDIYPE